jgi:hypothetical protein
MKAQGKPDFRPQETIAVVVGVEEYAVSEHWALTGPALDAAEFVEWLRGRDVPPGNIFPFISALERNRAEVEERLAAVGVGAPVPATTTELRSMFQEELRRESACARLLYVYWGGHGAMQADQDRRLFCTNAKAADLYPINFGSLLQMLRSRPWSRMRQVVVVDACANYYEEMNYRLNQAEVEFTPDAFDQGPDQLVLLAAASGEEAVNDPVRRSGNFSHRFLELIREAPAAEWPDFLHVAATLVEEFRVRAESEKAGQRPVLMRWSRSDGSGGGAGSYPVSREVQAAAAEGDVPIARLRGLVTLALERSSLGEMAGREGLVAALPPGRAPGRALRADDAAGDLLRVFSSALGTEERARELREAICVAEPDPGARDELVEGVQALRTAIRIRALLGDAPLTTDRLRALYRRSAPDPPSAPPASTLDEMIGHLQDMGRRDEGALPPLIEFVERVGRETGRADLTRWVDAWSTHQGGGIQPALTLRERLAREREAKGNQVATLSIDVSEAHTPTTHLGPHLRYWVYGPDQSFLAADRIDCRQHSGEKAEDATRAALASVLQRASDVLEESGETVPLAIELFVTLEQMAWPFDEWAMYLEEEESPSFGISYPVTLRWVERGRSQGSALQTERRNAWRRVARKIRDRVAQGQAPVVCWISRDGSLPQLVEARLKEGDYGAFVALEFVPAFDQASEGERRLVRAVLNGGAPFVLWRRRPPAAWRVLRAALDDFLCGHPFDEVPRRCVQLRREAVETADAASPGHSLAVLWDDPDRNPFDVLFSHHSQRTP